MIMCHMTATTSRELLAMADRIGVARRHIQYPGTFKEHFDICKSKRALAVKYGAIELSMREAAERYGERKHRATQSTEQPAAETTPMSDSIECPLCHFSPEDDGEIANDLLRAELCAACIDGIRANPADYGVTLKQVAAIYPKAYAIITQTAPTPPTE